MYVYMYEYTMYILPVHCIILHMRFLIYYHVYVLIVKQLVLSICISTVRYTFVLLSMINHCIIIIKIQVYIVKF